MTTLARTLSVVLLLALGLATSAARAATRPVDIDAPAPLKDLLVANLDLARATRLTGDAELEDGEWARLVQAAPAQVRELAGTEGFFAPEVDIQVTPGPGGAIRVRVRPGPQARIGRVTLQFDGDLDRAAGDGDPEAQALEASLREAWTLPEGAAFRNAAWGDAKAQWLARLRARGYGAAVWSGTAASVDPVTHTVRLFLVADSGPLFRAGDIVVEGLERQPASTVRDLAGFGEGAPLDETRLLDFQDRLQKTALFDQVAVTYDPDPAQAAHATVTVRVHEQRRQQLTTSAGVVSDTGPRVTLEYVNRRPFDQPVTAASKLVWGRDEQAWSLGLLTYPGRDFNSWLAGLSIDRLVTSTDVTRTSWVRFGRTRDTTRFERIQFGQVERSQQCVHVLDPVTGQPTGEPDECSDVRAVTLNQHTVWRRVDSIVLPTDGWTLNLQVGAGIASSPDRPSDPSTPYKPNGPFSRAYARYTQYWPLAGQWYLNGRVELGQVFADDNLKLPENELFRAGGDESVRGYPYQSLAPTNADVTVGGRSLLTLSAEVAHPVSAKLPMVWWAVFVDAGRAATRFNDLKLAVSPGVGVRWRSPVGPLRVDWAWGEEIHRGRLSLSIGIAF